MIGKHTSKRISIPIKGKEMGIANGFYATKSAELLRSKKLVVGVAKIAKCLHWTIAGPDIRQR